MKTYTRLTFTDREEISKGIWASETFTTIAERLHRPTSAVTREVWSNVKKKKRSYSAYKAHMRAEKIKQTGRRPKKLLANLPLQDYVYAKLREKWSPDEIAQRIKIDHPHDRAMRISHETIYRHIYCLPRGELRKELTKALRQERKMRQPRKYAHYRKQRIQDLISISERPQEVKDRIIPGHWEGDLIVGKDHQSAIGTLVERTTRLTLIVPLKAKDALSVNKAFAEAFKKIPKQFKKTLTYDRGSEMSKHLLFTNDTQIQVYFADPYRPWQRGTNENTNGLIRQYFPKGTDFRKVSLKELRTAEHALNSRPRKVLEYYTPLERFYELVIGEKIALES